MRELEAYLTEELPDPVIVEEGVTYPDRQVFLDSSYRLYSTHLFTVSR
jgi:hypothetical protein